MFLRSDAAMLGPNLNQEIQVKSMSGRISLSSRVGSLFKASFLALLQAQLSLHRRDVQSIANALSALEPSSNPRAPFCSTR